MDIKRIVKKVMCPFQCLRYGIKNRDGFLYIGKGCKIVNPKTIHFESEISIMPYTMLVCLEKEAKMSVGAGTQIGMFSRVASLNSVIIGKHVLTGPHIFIADYNHEYRDVDKPIMYQGNYIKTNEKFPSGGVKIGDDCWIGTNVVIAGSIDIGKHCIIGANSVVTHDIPDYSVAVGSPCEIIKQHNFKTQKWESVR